MDAVATKRFAQESEVAPKKEATEYPALDSSHVETAVAAGYDQVSSNAPFEPEFRAPAIRDRAEQAGAETTTSSMQSSGATEFLGDRAGEVDSLVVGQVTGESNVFITRDQSKAFAWLYESGNPPDVVSDEGRQEEELEPVETEIEPLPPGLLPELNEPLVFDSESRSDYVATQEQVLDAGQPASPEAYLEETLVFDASGNVYTSEDRQVVSGEESSEQRTDLAQEAETTFEQLVQLLDTGEEEYIQLTIGAEGEMAITFELEHETDEYADESENVTSSEEAWPLPIETSKEQTEVASEPPVHLAELIASVTEAEETVTLEGIWEQADQKPFEVTLARLALLLERPDDSLPDQLGGLIQQVNHSLQGSMEVAENNKKLHITPETLQSLLVLLYMTGHANPRESLLELVRGTDLQRLVQTMRYLAQLSNPHEQWEAADSPGLTADNVDTHHTLRTRIGKLAVMFHSLQSSPIK